MENSVIRINGKEFTGVKHNLGNANLLIIKNNRGFLACGYIDIETCNKLGDVAGIVIGVNNFKEMLDADVFCLSRKAEELFKMPVKGRDFLLNISK